MSNDICATFNLAEGLQTYYIRCSGENPKYTKNKKGKINMGKKFFLSSYQRNIGIVLMPNKPVDQP